MYGFKLWDQICARDSLIFTAFPPRVLLFTRYTWQFLLRETTFKSASSLHTQAQAPSTPVRPSSFLLALSLCVCLARAYFFVLSCYFYTKIVFYQVEKALQSF